MFHVPDSTRRGYKVNNVVMFVYKVTLLEFPGTGVHVKISNCCVKNSFDFGVFVYFDNHEGLLTRFI